ncbi:GNAT family N-acetyltransferase [Actinomadura kijaniata]|uniref:GNAT family N-acetyltransferase n=1 Tax=Actinomadura kijaniata TaxID=46161 RepID=UPI003F1AF7EF
MVSGGSMFIHTVMTDHGPDGHGVGSALLAHAEHLARTRGALALALDHWAGSPELGYVPVVEYTVRNLVRVQHLSGDHVGFENEH